MKVLVVSPEAVPFAKTGGLADVAGVLPAIIKAQGIDTALILPLYRMVNREKFRLRKSLQTIDIPISDRIESASVWEGTTWNNVPVYFIEKEKYYNRDYLYSTPQSDYPDNAERFVFFSKAVLEVCKATKFRPDVIHCNDWQSALVPLYMKTLYRDDPFFKETSSVITIHNLGYQGIFWHYDMHLLGIGWEYFTPEGIEFYGKINFLKAGLIFSEVITTVSETYSKEIQTDEYGFGLDGVLRKRSRDLYGVINGIDYNEWNPSIDSNIKEPYG
ncbi:MAG: glycogen/starch synthase, partial [Nitrospirota bacterium]